MRWDDKFNKLTFGAASKVMGVNLTTGEPGFHLGSEMQAYVANAFAGIASPDTVPEAVAGIPMVMIAMEAGTYANFLAYDAPHAALVVNAGEYVVLSYDGSASIYWQKTSMPYEVAYQVWEAMPENEGKTLADYLDWIEQLILDEADRVAAELLRVQAEQARVTEEGLRVTAEGDRVVAEQARVAAELLRVQAEQARVAAELLRVQAEQARVAAEGLRATAEGDRATAEGRRVLAEDARVYAEASRVSSEDVRVANELVRISHEADRISAENLRVIAEGVRVAAENLRISAEEGRDTAEHARVLAENARVLAEGLRVTAEEARVTAEGLRVTAEEARVTAEGLRVIAEQARVTAEGLRVTAEEARVTAEGLRVTAEQGRVTAEGIREDNEDIRIANEIARLTASSQVKSIVMTNRVLADGGAVHDKELMDKAYLAYLNQLPETVFLFNPHSASKERTSGVNKYFSKVYDHSTNNYDAVQLTDAVQPYASIGAAPSAKKGIKYVSGQTQTGLLDFTDKVFAAGDSWTFTVVVRTNNQGILLPRMELGTNERLYLASNLTALNNGSTGAPVSTTAAIPVGRTAVVEFQYSNGVGLVKINNIPQVTTSASHAMNFRHLASNLANAFDGTLYHAHLTNTRKSEYQSALDYTFLRSMYPEIEGIGIGNQWWATSNYEGIVDGAGNAIPEVQNATATEKITDAADRDFSSNTGFWTLTSQVTIAGGVCNIKSTDGSLQTLNRNGLMSVGKMYKLTYTVTRSATGTIATDSFVQSNYVLPSTVGTYTLYLVAVATSCTIKRNGGITDIDIDNISLEECGWSDSTNIYNARITAGDSVAAAQRAAAMYCHYNNDPANGAVYGKLYNWYAVAMIAANPPKGWRVPTSADFTQLSAFLGGDAPTASSIMMSGNIYWNSNQGNNASGFSCIGAGLRGIDGLFLYTKDRSYLWTSTNNGSGNSGIIRLINNSPNYVNSALGQSHGMSLRLLRNEPNLRDMETIMETSTTDIASSAKTIVLPCGMRLKDMSFSSVNALTNLKVEIYDYANTTLLATPLATVATHAAGADITYPAAWAAVPTPYQNRTVRITAAGNTGGLIQIRLVCEKIFKAP